jgi:hypothetical protein
MTATTKPVTSNAASLRVDSRDGRMYGWGDETFHSVTTILNALGKPWLGAWAAKMVAEGTDDMWDEIGRMRKRDSRAAIRFMKGLPWDKRDKAADLGTAVHDAIEAAVLGQTPPPYAPDVAPRMGHFDRFTADYRPTWLASEATVFSRKYKYAGTLDGIAKIGAETLLIDVKTSRDIYPEYALQLAAYRHAEFLGLPDGSEAPVPATDGAAVLHITPDDYRLVRLRSDDEVLRYFLYVAQAHRWMKDVSRTAILDPVPIPDKPAAQVLADTFGAEVIAGGDD